MAKISKRKPRPIAVFDEKTMSLKLDKKKFKKKFDDGTPITSFEIKRMGKNLYFVRSGRDRKRNCHLWAATVKLQKRDMLFLCREAAVLRMNVMETHVLYVLLLMRRTLVKDVFAILKGFAIT
ncbi:MAG: hypothetical protein L0Y79_00035 [Chlorobi bacterium]|nr:hypothetical protein [Chlorobiota bacterium]MCI0716532.1 hypothetical protein [Chlorobiota bacterium]